MDNSKLIKVAAVQMSCILADKDNNLAKAEKLVIQAINNGAKLIVLPELFNTGYRVEEHDYELSETIHGKTTEWMEKICKQHNVYLVGSMLERSKVRGVVYDTAVVVGPNGLIGSYQKNYLWQTENLRFAEGKDYQVFQLDFSTLGVQICYEIGFPEGARKLTLQGADILVYPSAFAKERSYAWDIATRARALENGLFVIAANRSGVEKDDTEFAGLSRIIDPQGKVLAEAENEYDVIIALIDLTKVEKQRKAIPYLRDLKLKNGGLQSET